MLKLNDPSLLKS